MLATCGVRCGSITMVAKRFAAVMSLDDYVKLDLLEKEEPEQIKQIWLEYHKQQNCISATIEPKLFNELIPRCNECPLFVLPMPRKNHFEMMLLQCRGALWAITPLHDYQKEGEFAKPVISLQFFSELAASKNLILMRGDIHTDQLTPTHAQSLINQAQLFYLNDDKYENVVKVFNFQPKKFDYNSVLDSLGSTGIDAKKE